MYKKIIVPIAMDQLEHGESVLGIAEKLIDEGERLFCSTSSRISTPMHKVT